MILYKDYRPQINSGDIIALTHKGWLPFWYSIQVQGVMFATKSPFSHVAVVWVVGSRVFIIESVIPYVRIFPLSWVGDFFHLPLNIGLNDEALDFALTMVGKKVKYSKLDGIKALCGVNTTLNHATQCAELVKMVQILNGLTLPNRPVPGDVVLDVMSLGVPLINVMNHE